MNANRTTAALAVGLVVGGLSPIAASANRARARPRSSSVNPTSSMRSDSDPWGFPTALTVGVSRLHMQLKLGVDLGRTEWMVADFNEDSPGPRRTATVVFQRDARDDPLAEAFPIEPIPFNPAAER